MKKRLIQKAASIARELALSGRHPQDKFFMHVSFVVQERTIVGWGVNHQGFPAIHHGYSKGEDSHFKPKTHAEWSAYRKVRGILEPSAPFELVNVRVNRRGELKLSKPCDVCFRLLSSLGCKAFYYSSEVGFLKLASLA